MVVCLVGCLAMLGILLGSGKILLDKSEQWKTAGLLFANCRPITRQFSIKVWCIIT